ncbi:MAG: class I SAM-dependent methyltransferase [Planctomycetota bacterium]|nr:class I SAM-dependent methyltransferase [Planctomycetota bacterium]
MSGAPGELAASAWAPVLEELGARSDRVRTPTDPPTSGGAGSALAALPESADPAAAAAAILDHAARSAAPDGWLLVVVTGSPSDARLAALRDALWPEWHVSALYTPTPGGIERRSLDGSRTLRSSADARGVLVAARRREIVLAPDATVAKFDKNAAGWNGVPGRPGYGHFRWMRRFVADMAGEHRARRILDFGCGAGWVGIEAALSSRSRGGSPELAAFDPSPEMVRITEENARSAGVERCTGRTGFGEDPPFPAAGEAAFDLVLSSGVVSFARDRKRWFDGLDRGVAPGGTLVIGDIHPGSKGMMRRRREKPLLPIREMNGMRREEARAELERRGFRFQAWSGYQLSDPVPQWNHLDATRLRGLLGPVLLAWNRRAAASSLARDGADQDRFDSWVMRFVR